jgi:lipopolysaccharide exporter
MAHITSASILAKTATGAGWIIGWRMLTRILGLANTLLLVRLLLPEDFGLVALAMSFSQAIDALSWLGVEEAVIREKAPSSDLYDSAFIINVIRGVATSAILAAGAWPVGLFFHDARLFPVMLALAAGSLVVSFENIGIVDFRRGIAFEKEFLLMSVPRLTMIVVSVGLGCIFRSYWALIAAILTSQIGRVAMGYKLHPYRPRLGLRA